MCKINCLLTNSKSNSRYPTWRRTSRAEWSSLKNNVESGSMSANKPTADSSNLPSEHLTFTLKIKSAYLKTAISVWATVSISFWTIYKTTLRKSKLMRLWRDRERSKEKEIGNLLNILSKKIQIDPKRKMMKK